MDDWERAQLIELAAEIEGVSVSDILAAGARDNGEIVVVVKPGQKHVWTPEQVARRLEELELRRRTTDGGRRTAESDPSTSSGRAAARSDLAGNGGGISERERREKGENRERFSFVPFAEL
jgi:hypothetical protein